MTTANDGITEIVAGVRQGRYRMVNCKSRPLYWRRANGEWIPLCKYHPNTIRAAQRRLTYRFDETTLTGVYE